MAKVYVTDSQFESLDREEKTLRDAGHDFAFLNTKDPAELIRLAHDAEGLLVQFAPITDEVLAALPNLKVMVRYGVGYDNFDVAAAHKRGVIACNCPGYCIDEVADHTLAMILAAARRLPQIGNEIASGHWNVPDNSRPIMALRGKVLGLVGFGAIAKQVAKRAIAFGMQVFASDPLLTDTIAKEHGIESVSLDSLWPVADFVSVHCPLTASTRNIIDGAAIARMKRGVVVINNGRGGLLDEEALYAALVDKHVAYAALDVLAKEPPASDYALLALPNVLVTPHIASVSETSVDRLQQMAVDEVVRVLGGQPALNPIR